MKRLLPYFLLLLLFTPAYGQEVISSDEAVAIIARLKEDPAYETAKEEMAQLVEWMTTTDKVYVYINQKEVNKILKQDFPYKKEMYILLLAGMAKYDLEHPEDDLQKIEVDKTDGYMCMCTGYRNIITKKQLKPVKYYDKLCKKYCGI